LPFTWITTWALVTVWPKINAPPARISKKIPTAAAIFLGPNDAGILNIFGMNVSFYCFLACKAVNGFIVIAYAICGYA